jgi:Ca2+-binding EF-hand superfamily protein
MCKNYRAIITKISHGAENWLKNNFEIDLNNLEQNENKRSFNNSNNNHYNFYNKNSFRLKEKEKENQNKKLNQRHQIIPYNNQNENNRKEENEDWLLQIFSQWLKLNHKVSDNELFTAMDYDSDGIISINDFKIFLTKRLNFSKFDFNNSQLEKTLQTISLSKNNNFSLSDLQEFIYINNKNPNQNTNTNNNNNNQSIKSCLKLNNNKDNFEFYENLFEKLGIFIFENYGDLRSFFEDNSNNGKIYLENFQNFIKKNLYAEKLNLNLTPEEIINLFSLFDTEKNNFLKLENIENKLRKFDFYEKMHIEIINFINSNFKDGIGAFKYFMQKNKKNTNTNSNGNFNKNNFAVFNNNINNNNYNSNENENLNLNLSRKEILDGLNFLFPRKFSTQILLNYLKKRFKNIEQIPFSEFNYVYFDDIKSDLNLIKTINSFKNYKDNKTGTYFINLNNNLNIENKVDNSTLFSKSCKNFRSKSLYTSDKIGNKLLHKLDTPFDEDPLEKIRRIIYASRFNFMNYFKMYDSLTVNGMVNHSQFKNMLKKMNIGITTLEIDQIMAKAGLTREGMINIRDFVEFLQIE